MKRALAVALLVMSFAAVALADGSDPIPPVIKPPKPPAASLIRLTDGSDPIPPIAKPPKPPKWYVAA